MADSHDTTPLPSLRHSTAVAAIGHGMAAAMAENPDGEAARAYPIFDAVPAGHMLFRVDDDCHAPHLQVDEWAVIDTTDRAVTWGELHLVLQSKGPFLWQVNRPYGIWARTVNPDRPTAMLSPLNRPKILPNGQIDWSKPVHLSDGPIYLDGLEPLLLGRVVGIFVGPDEFSRRRRAIAEGRRAEDAVHRSEHGINGGRA